MKRKCASKADKKISKNLNNPNICCSTPPWSNDQRFSLTLFLFLFYQRLFHTFFSKHSNPISPRPPPFPPSQSDKGLCKQYFPKWLMPRLIWPASQRHNPLSGWLCAWTSAREYLETECSYHTQHLLYKSEYWMIRDRAKLITALFIEKYLIIQQ